MGTHRHRAVQETLWDPTLATKIQDPMKLDPTAAMKNHGGTNVRGAGTGRPAPGGTILGWKGSANSLTSKMNKSGLAQDARGDPLDNVDTMNTLRLKVNADGPRRSIAHA